jgi:hypothetical protein
MANVIDIRTHARRRVEARIWANRHRPSIAKAMVIEAAQCGWLTTEEAESWIVLQGLEAA